MKRSKVGTAAELKRLRNEVRGLRVEVNLWREYAISTYPPIRKSIEAADREYRKKGGTPLEDVIRGLEAGGKIPRKLRMKFLRRSGKKIQSQLKKRGMTEEKSWRTSKLGGKRAVRLEVNGGRPGGRS